VKGSTLPPTLYALWVEEVVEDDPRSLDETFDYDERELVGIYSSFERALFLSTHINADSSSPYLASVEEWVVDDEPKFPSTLE